MRKFRIIIADDDPVFLQFLSDCLQDDYELLLYKNGREVLANFDQAEPDLCLLDVKMPEMDGYEVTRRLRTNQENQSLSIIMMSVLNSQKDFQKGYDCGANLFLNKPLDPKRLKKLLVQELRRMRGTPQKKHLSISELTKKQIAKERVMVVDDDPSIRKSIGEVLANKGYEVCLAADAAEALRIAKKNNVGAAILDLNLPGMKGTELSQHLKDHAPDIEIIVLTGYPSIQSAVEAIKHHVFDYLSKPVLMEDLLSTLERALERRRLILENRKLLEELKKERKDLRKKVNVAKRALDTIESQVLLGESAAMRQVRKELAEVAISDMVVLLRGESGTGKDLAAQLIHQLSDYRGGSFVKINCPAIPETLLESELFGHEAGAFTGAQHTKPGRIEMAAGGTAFLDEIAEIPTTLQAKLLQVIESKIFNRLGSNKEIKINARIISATNASLDELIQTGRFRSDLYYRLNEYCITLPPLRERKSDILLLVNHFLGIFAGKYQKKKMEVPAHIIELFMKYHWPGNVRELKSLVERFVLTGNVAAFEASLGQPTAKVSLSPKLESLESNELTAKLKSAEVLAILEALEKSNWNRKAAAKMLNIGYSSLRRKITRHHLTPPEANPI